ncbi:MAG: flagellar hook-associated protein FlgK [Calditrichia bacterium]
MPGIFQSLDIARRAIWASRTGMDVTSHNIANVNTPGFSRQRVDQRAARPLNLPQGQLGLGVTADTVIRIRSGLLDQQFRQNAFSLGGAEVNENLFGQIEAILQEPSENAIGSLMTDFFSEFSSLAAEPENTALRTTLREKAVALSDAFHNAHGQLQDLRNSISGEAKSMINEINSLTGELAKLNNQITGYEAGGGQANDLRDQRDLVLDKLSGYLKINYSEDNNGSVTVSSESMTLVSGVRSNPLSLDTSKENDVLQIRLEGNGDILRQPAYGKLGALMSSYNSSIPKIQQRLDDLAGRLSGEVNRLHRRGQGLNGAGTGFDFFTGNSAATLRVSDDIMEDLSRIAVSSDGSAGNGEVASAIANLRDAKLLDNGTATFNSFYNGVVNQLSLDIQQASTTRNNQQLLQQQISNQRTSASGVSLDEEMTNMIKYQRAFEAASKVVKVVDDMLQTLINMAG